MHEQAVRKAASDVAASLRATAVQYQDEWSPGALEVLLLAAKEVEAIPDAEPMGEPVALRPDRECRHCGQARSAHGSMTRSCPTGGTSFWPVGEPGGG
jgi:hypothetical protein